MHDDDKIARYFLGKLSTQEAEQFERECFDDRTFAESVCVVEDELNDQYVRDELSQDDRELFERFYLTTEARRRRVEMARCLNNTMNPAKVTELAKPSELHRLWQRVAFNRPLSRYALATLILAMVAISVWLLTRKSKNEQIAGINPPINAASPLNTPTPITGSSPTESASPTGTPAGQPPSSEVATTVFILFPGTHRAEDTPEQVIKLSPQTEVVELRFVIHNDVPPPYEIIIETVEGGRVLLRRGLTGRKANNRQVVVVRVPASAFAARNYIGKVLGSNGDAAPSYSFRVTKTN